MVTDYMRKLQSFENKLIELLREYRNRGLTAYDMNNILKDHVGDSNQFKGLF